VDLSKYTGSALYNAEKIPPGVKIEEIVAGFEARQFDDGEKAVMLFESGMGVVLNPTRALVMTQAFGRESDNMIGEAILVSRGTTRFGADPHKPCVVIEAVNPIGITAQKPKPALGQRAAIDIRPGRGARQADAPPPPDASQGDGPADRYGEPDDDVPF
jgi:hypothetical protein